MIHRRSALCATLLLVAMGAAIAQDPALGRDQAAGQKTQYRSKELIRSDLKNQAGENLGQVRDLVVAQDGRINYAVLSFERLLGHSENYFAVPWENLRTSADGKNLILDTSKEQMEGAPRFDKNKWPDMTNAEWSADVDAFHGRTEPLSGVGGKISDLENAELRNASDQRIGSIQHILVDVERGRLSMFLANPDARILAGNKLVAIPWSAVSVTPGEKAVILSPPEYTLKTAPSFDATRWPAINSDYAARVERHFGGEETQERPVALGDRDPAREPTSRGRSEVTAASVFRPVRASRVIDAKISDQGGRASGSINDLVIHPQLGTVEYVVIAIPKPEGKLVAIPAELVQFAADGTNRVMVPLDRIFNAPSFTQDTWPDTKAEAWHLEVHRHFGTHPRQDGDTRGRRMREGSDRQDKEDRKEGENRD